MKIKLLRISNFVVVASLFLTVVACDGADVRKEKYLSKGNEYLNNNKFDKAKIEFKNVLQIDPKSVAGHFNMANLNEKVKQFRSDLAGYNKVIELQPDHKEALASVARLYFWGNANDQAMEYAEKALKLDPQYPDALVVQASIYVRRSKIDLALKTVRSALEVDPDHVSSIALLSRIYLTKEQPEKASALLYGAQKRQPENIELLSLIVQLYSDNNDYIKFIEAMKQLIILKSDDLSYRMRLAYFYDVNNDKAEAEVVLRNAVTDLPENIEAKKALIQYLAKERDLMFAQLELSRFIKSDGNNPELHLISALLYMQSNEAEKAEAVYRDIIRKYGNESFAVTSRYELVRLLLSSNKREDAKAELALLLSDNPKNFDALSLRGVLALEDRDAKTAISDFRSVLNDQPQSVKLIKLLANAYLMDGDLALAEQQLKTILQLSPKDMASRLSYAEILHEAKQYADAINQLMIVLKLEPQNTKANLLLFKAYLVQGNYSQALDLSEAFQTSYPDSSLGYFYHGLVLQAEQKYQQSMLSFEKAMTIEPKSIEALSSYVRSALALSKPKLAEVKLKSVINAQPGFVIAHNLLGEVFSQQKKNKLAISAFSNAIENNPKWWIPYRNLASVQLLMKQPEMAIKTLRKGVDLVASPSKLIFQLVTLLEQQGEIGEAVMVYEKLLEKQPNASVVANNLALLLIENKEDQSSKDRAMSLVSQFHTSDNPSYLDTLGWVYYKRGEYEKALSALLQADVLAPQQPLIHYHLGAVYFEKGDSDIARKYLEKVVKSKQEFKGAGDAKRMLAELSSSINNV